MIAVTERRSMPSPIGRGQSVYKSCIKQVTSTRDTYRLNLKCFIPKFTSN